MRRPRSFAAPVGALLTMAALAGLVASPGAAGAQTEADASTEAEAPAATESQSWLDLLTGGGQSGAGQDETGQTGQTGQASATGSFQRGPAPNDRTVYGRGPFSISRRDVSGSGAGFNNATVYYPNDTSQGTFAAIAVSPGFMTPKSLMQWAGPKIASHGFVVAVMEPNTVLDFPGARADQMQALLRYLTTRADETIRSRIDPDRLGAIGHSMGGGGALEVGDRNRNPRVRAVVGLQPWDMTRFAGMDVPTLIVGASNDLIAATASHSEPFYNSILVAEKAYVELSGQGHTVGVTDNGIQSAVSIAWFKRFLDNDTRYDRFLCPPVSGMGVAETRSTCPLS